MIFVVGPSKTGTDFLHAFLSDCKSFDMCHGKSTFYFSDHFHRGDDWYYSHFNQSGQKKLEVCHDYFASEMAMRRIAAKFPKATIIVVIRHPVDRAVSSILYYRKNGYNASVNDLINDYPSIIEESLYFKYVSRWVEFFDREQIKFIHFHDLKDSDTLKIKLGRITNVNISLKTSSYKNQKNSAKQPRWIYLSRIVKVAAVMLRRLGFGRVVHKVHSSKIIDFLLYKGVSSSLRNDTYASLIKNSRYQEIVSDFELFENFLRDA